MVRAKAIERANRPTTRWTPKRIIRRIREYARNFPESELQKALSYTTARNSIPRVVSAAENHLGGWTDARRRAGFTVEFKKPRDPESLKKQGHAWTQENGPLCTVVLEDSDPALLAAMVREFGSLQKAAEELDLPFERRYVQRSRESIMEELKEWSKEHGSVNVTSLRQTNLPLERAIRRHFATMEEASDAAGVPYKIRKTPVRKWTKERVIANIRALEASGVRVCVNEAKKQMPGLVDGATGRFGTWRAAVKAAGVDGKKDPKWDDPKFLKQRLAQWVDKYGRVTDRKLYHTAPRLHRGLSDKYDSLDIAFKALGLPKDRIGRSKRKA